MTVYAKSEQTDITGDEIRNIIAEYEQRVIQHEKDA